MNKITAPFTKKEKCYIDEKKNRSFIMGLFNTAFNFNIKLIKKHMSKGDGIMLGW